MRIEKRKENAEGTNSVFRLLISKHRAIQSVKVPIFKTVILKEGVHACVVERTRVVFRG